MTIEAATLLAREPASEAIATRDITPFVLNIADEHWTEDTEKELTTFLDDELQSAAAERGRFIQKIARWTVAYHAPLPSGPKTFPFFGASNLIVPIIKETVNTLGAQIVQSTTVNRPRFILQDNADEFEEFIDELEEFLDLASERDFDLESLAVPLVHEVTNLGTGVVEVGYRFDERKVFRYTEDGRRVYAKKIVVADAPCPIHHPIQNVWVRAAETDVQTMRWIAFEYWYTEAQLLQLEKQGKFENVKDVIDSGGENDRDPVTQVSDDVEEIQPLNRRRKHRIFKVYCSFDIDGDGNFEELILHYNKERRVYLSKRYNPMYGKKRRIVVVRYTDIPHRFWGMGIAEMLEMLQIAISAKHNQRSDNATLANAKMIIKKPSVRKLQPGDPIYPAKQIEAQNPFTDIREFSLSEIYPSTVAEEQILRGYADRLSGNNEAVAGAQAPVTRTTATAQIALLQEQLKRIDLPIKNVRRGLSEIGRHAFYSYLRFGTLGKGVAWMGQRGEIVDAFFALPKKVLDMDIGISINVPTSSMNRQVKRENSLALFNLMVSLYEKLLPLAAALAPDRVGEVANALVASAQKFMGDVLESFEVSDPEEILAGLTVLGRVLPQPADLGGLAAFQASESTSEVIEKLRGLENLLIRVEEAQIGGDRGGTERGTRRRTTIPVPERIFGRGPTGVSPGGGLNLQREE